MPDFKKKKKGFNMKNKGDFDFGNKGNFDFNKTNEYIDPDAPGVPGTPGYEPPVTEKDKSPARAGQTAGQVVRRERHML